MKIQFAGHQKVLTYTPLPVITRIVPKGEYSDSEISYAIRGSYGSYVRIAAAIALAESTEEKLT